MKKTLPFLVIFLLFFSFSCRKGGESIGIWSEKGAVVYSNKAGNSKIVVSGELLDEITKDMETEEAIRYLFPDTLFFPLDEGQWKQREIVEASLISFTATETMEEAYRKEKKSIGKSRYLENMEEISGDFERRLLSMVGKSGSRFSEYSADSVVGEEGGGEDKRLFLKRWIKAIVG